ELLRRRPPSRPRSRGLRAPAPRLAGSALRHRLPRSGPSLPSASGGKGEGERGAAPRGVLDPDLALHEAEKSLGDGQPEPSAQARVPLGHLIEGIEQLLADGLRYAPSVVDDPNHR